MAMDARWLQCEAVVMLFSQLGVMGASVQLSFSFLTIQAMTPSSVRTYLPTSVNLV